MTDINILFLVSRVILRLAILPFNSPTNLLKVIAQGTESLKVFEASSDIIITSMSDFEITRCDADLPPHMGQRIHKSPLLEPLQAWGKTAENFWQANMTSPRKGSTWDALSCRTLLWRSLAGEKRSVVGEWLRQQVITSLSEGFEYF